MVLPGPEAQQLATYIGWLMHKPGEASSPGAGFFALARYYSSPWRGSISSAGDVAVVAGIFMASNPP
ncbi:hypothetical protein LNQ03_28480 [Klebsiella pneumoniae subsp. pneumoniae]|nr:hypothetical protein [Klebsiella pneumoniae subsp. pneumoniae]